MRMDLNANSLLLARSTHRYVVPNLPCTSSTGTATVFAVTDYIYAKRNINNSYLR
jgi:hypothetical protein